MHTTGDIYRVGQDNEDNNWSGKPEVELCRSLGSVQSPCRAAAAAGVDVDVDADREREK